MNFEIHPTKAVKAVEFFQSRNFKIQFGRGPNGPVIEADGRKTNKIRQDIDDEIAFLTSLRNQIPEKKVK